jgi:intraflagellar transport protein 46
VSDEIKGLFQYIDRYQPQEVDIGTILKPFIPDFLPAIGTVDEFLNVPRPDGLPDFLGLKVPFSQKVVKPNLSKYLCS